MINKTIFRLTLAILTGSLLLSFPSSKLLAEEESTFPDQPSYEAIGMMIAHGSGLHKMDFSAAQIKAILAGLEKGFVLQEIPEEVKQLQPKVQACLLYTSPSPRDGLLSRMPSSA